MSKIFVMLAIVCISYAEASPKAQLEWPPLKPVTDRPSATHRCHCSPAQTGACIPPDVLCKDYYPPCPPGQQCTVCACNCNNAYCRPI